MRTIQIGKHRVEYYDGIDEMPIVRFHKWQKMLMVDAGIGGDIASLDQHLEKTRRYIRTGKYDQAEKEIANLRQCVYLMQTELNPTHLAFAALVKSIDGAECDNITDDGLRDVVARLSDSPRTELTDATRSVKKKIEQEITLYFPRVFADSEVKEYYDLIRKRTLVVLHGIECGLVEPDATEEVEQLNDQIILFVNPRTFEGAGSAEIQYDREFENLCLILGQKLNIDPKRKTVMEFYNAFEYLKDKAKKEQAQNKRQ